VVVKGRKDGKDQFRTARGKKGRKTYDTAARVAGLGAVAAELLLSTELLLSADCRDGEGK
jgi:hypothetical protein